MTHSKCEHLGRQSPISNSKLVLFNPPHFVRQVLSDFPQNSEVAWRDTKDANDAEGMASDPAAQAVVGHRATPGNPCPDERQGARGDCKGSIVGAPT